MRKKIFFFLFFLIFNHITYSKSVRFKKIENYKKLETKNFKIIFPENFTEYSQKLANLIEHLYDKVPNSLNIKPKKSTIYIKNQRAISNGGAFFNNMFFFICPPQNSYHLGTYDWLESLAVHEFRHVAQFSFIKKKISPYIPIWFWEGDAVVIETALSKSGRGRIPNWTLLYKTNLLEKGIFSFSKNEFGSFRDPIPDHYRLGFLLVNYLRQKYGKEIIAKIYQKTVNSKSLFFGFEKAIKSATNKSLNEIYLDLNEELKKLWSNQLKDLNINEANYLIPKDKYFFKSKNSDIYLNNFYPQIFGEDKLLYLEYGIGDILKFASINVSTPHLKKHIYIPNNIEFGAGFSYANSKLVWSEIESHPRWSFLENFVIKIHDLVSKKTKTIYDSDLYLKAPDICPFGKRIVAVQSSKDYKHQIVVYDSITGKLLKKFKNPKNFFFCTPKWSKDGTKIITIQSLNQQKNIVQIDYNSGKQISLLSNKHSYKKAKYQKPFMEYNISNARQYDNYIFYNACYNGIDNIYALNLHTKKIYQVTSRKYGGYNAIISKDKNWIYFNDFTKDGYKIMKMAYNPKKWIPLNQIKDREIYLYKEVCEQEDSRNTLKNIPNKIYEIKNYAKYIDLYNYFPPSHTPPSYGISDIGIDTHQIKTFAINKQIDQNYLFVNQLPIMNSFTFSLLSSNDYKGNFTKDFIKLSLQRFFPIFEIGIEFNKYHTNSKPFYSLNGIDFSLRIPLCLKKYGYKHVFVLELENTFLKDYFSFEQNLMIWSKNQVWKKKLNFLFIRKLVQSLQDIKPKWGQSLSLSFMLNEKPDFLFHSNFFFPSLFKNHSIELNFVKKLSTIKSYFYDNKNNKYFYFLKKLDYLEAKINYYFPILYLDLGLPGYLYNDFLVTFSDLSNDDKQLNNLNLKNFGSTLWIAIETYFNIHFGLSFYYEYEKPFVGLNFQIYV